MATVQTLVGATITNRIFTVTNSGGRYYGTFCDTITQTISVANETKAITLNTTIESNAVSVVGNTKLTVANAGVYNIQFSAQLANSSTATRDASIWFKKNGSIVTDSNSVMAVVGTHGGVDGHSIVAANFVLTLAAADYVELWWSADDPGVKLQYYTGVSPIPNAPSVIVTVVQV
jgi:hypothetical protein